MSMLSRFTLRAADDNVIKMESRLMRLFWQALLIAFASVVVTVGFGVTMGYVDTVQSAANGSDLPFATGFLAGIIVLAVGFLVAFMIGAHMLVGTQRELPANVRQMAMATGLAALGGGMLVLGYFFAAVLVARIQPYRKTLSDVALA